MTLQDKLNKRWNRRKEIANKSSFKKILINPAKPKEISDYYEYKGESKRIFKRGIR